MLKHPHITENNQLECPTHSQAITQVTYPLTDRNTKIRLLCPDCKLSSKEKSRESAFEANFQQQTFVITFLDLPNSQPAEDQQEATLTDFRHLLVEHIIVDKKSQGYSPRNLVWMSMLNLLAACSSNGNVKLWSVGDRLELQKEFSIEKCIKFAKYIPRYGLENYLFLGAENQIHIYQVNEQHPRCAGILDYEAEVNDFAWIYPETKIVTAGCDRYLRVWNLENSSIERKIDIEACNIKGAVSRVIYLHEKNMLALEDDFGFYLIDFKNDSVENNKFFNYSKDGRQTLGFTYLPQTHNFILMSDRYTTDIIQEENLELKLQYPLIVSSRSQMDSQLLPNENESQFIANCPPARLYVFLNDGSHHILKLCELVKENAALEVIKDHHRIVLGDQNSGNLYILRTNAPESDFKVSGGEISLERNESALKSLKESLVKQEQKKDEEMREEEEEKTMPTKTARSNRKVNREESSRDQLRERAAKKQEDPKRQNNKEDNGEMELEEPKGDLEEEKATKTKRNLRSMNKKSREDERDEEKDGNKTRLKTKNGTKKGKEEKEEKTRSTSRTKAMRGKKKE